MLILTSFRKSWGSLILVAPIKSRRIKRNSQEWFDGQVAEKKVSVISYLRNLNNQNFVQARVPEFTTNNTALPLLPAFMDDLNFMSSTVSAAQTVLSQCITALT